MNMPSFTRTTFVFFFSFMQFSFSVTYSNRMLESLKSSRVKLDMFIHFCNAFLNNEQLIWPYLLLRHQLVGQFEFRKRVQKTYVNVPSQFDNSFDLATQGVQQSAVKLIITVDKAPISNKHYEARENTGCSVQYRYSKTLLVWEKQ